MALFSSAAWSLLTLDKNVRGQKGSDFTDVGGRGGLDTTAANFESSTAFSAASCAALVMGASSGDAEPEDVVWSGMTDFRYTVNNTMTNCGGWGGERRRVV